MRVDASYLPASNPLNANAFNHILEPPPLVTLRSGFYAILPKKRDAFLISFMSASATGRPAMPSAWLG
jgi:hypothetical protein